MAKKKISTVFNKPKMSSMTRPDGAGNYDNMDDYNIVNSIDLDTGTIQSAPVNPKDICNKEYHDKELLKFDDAFNVEITTADTEYSVAIPANTKKIRFKLRYEDGGSIGAWISPSSVYHDIRWAWETGKVATPTSPYFTLHWDEVYSIEGLNLTGATLYFASDLVANADSVRIVEVETWD